MDRNLSCNIHSSYPIYHIDILENSQKKLQCIKCISYQKMEKNFLLIPEILNYDQKFLLQNWPPLNDEILRNKILSLESEENDLNQQINDFYDELIKELTQILSEKKKKQLILAQKAYEFKEQIIQQYQQMASIDKIKEFFVEENKEREKVEQDLNDYIDAQFKRKDEYTTILSCMMQQYELIRNFDIQKPTQIKKNVEQILQIINLMPLNNFNFESEIQIFKIDNIDNYKQKLKEEDNIQNKNNQILDNLIKQLSFCNEQLIELINQNKWQLHDFLLNLKKFKNQIDSSKLQENMPLNINKSQQQIEANIFQLKGNVLKCQNKLQQQLLLENKVILDDINSKQNSLFQNFNFQLRFQVQINQNKDKSFFNINYILKPEKKYIFRFKAIQSKSESNLRIGIISDSCQKKKIKESWFGSDLSNLQQYFVKHYKLIQVNLCSTWQFKICLKDQLFQMTDYPNLALNISLKKEYFLPQVNDKYYFGGIFFKEYPGDQIEIFDCQELDEF